MSARACSKAVLRAEPSRPANWLATTTISTAELWPPTGPLVSAPLEQLFVVVDDDDELLRGDRLRQR